jgi:hypothetical protein
MLYKCIWQGCNKIWGEAEPANNGCQHGLCAAHARLAFKNTFRSLQIQEGNPDCYLSNSGSCHRHWCTFHPICTVKNSGPEEMAELGLRLAARHQTVLLLTTAPAYLIERCSFFQGENLSKEATP